MVTLFRLISDILFIISTTADVRVSDVSERSDTPQSSHVSQEGDCNALLLTRKHDPRKTSVGLQLSHVKDSYTTP